MEIKRDMYLQRLVASRHNGMIKVVTGIRRCGKSYLLFKLFYDFLKGEGVDDSHIVRVDLEDRRNSALRDPDALLTYIDGRMTDGGMYYILLDEVQREANLATAPSENWTWDQELIIPVSAKTTQGDAYNPGVEISAKAMTYAGDYIFTFMCANGTINIYERAEGNRFVGALSPGAEVEKKSGWTDFCFAINARKNDDGTYEILAEENAYAKVLHYTIKDFEGDFKQKGDLEPQRIWLKDGAGELIDPTNIPEGQPVTFTARIKNVGIGTVKGIRWSDPVHFIAGFKVYDSNDEVVYQAQSKGCTEELLSGAYVDLDIEFKEGDEFWRYTQGKYRVEVDANYSNKADECTIVDNNLLSLDFGGGDNSGEITGPLVPEIEDESGLGGTAQLRMSVYPNPATDRLTVCAATTDSDIAITLTSLDGKTVLTQRMPNNASVDVSHLAAGYYFLQVSASDGNRVEKIMVK